MNSTSSALPSSGVAPETSDQTVRPKLLSQVRIVLSAVLVSIWGSDGAGGYNVVWKLRANGRHTRVFKAS